MQKRIQYLVVLGAVLTGLGTFAAENNKTVEADRARIITTSEARREDRKTKVTEKIGESCDRVTQKIDLITTRATNNKTRREGLYTTLKDNVKNLVTKLEAQGYDVTELKADLVTLDEKLKATNTAFNEFTAALESTKQYACGESEGQFKDALATARSEQKEFNKSLQDIRLFYQQEIRADIQNIKAQKATKTPS